MSEVLETSAVTPVESATTSEVSSPAFDATNQATWSPKQKEEWNKTGTQPTKADSATATKEEKKDAVADSAPPKEAKKEPADSASDSATDKESKPHLKTKEDTEKRFSELLDRVKRAEERAEAAERRTKATETRDTKQESQPAPETYKPLDSDEYFKANPKATYEDFVRAAAKHEAKWEVKQEMALENQRRAQAEAQKELSTRIEEAKKRYPDFEARIQPAVEAIETNQRIPLPVKAMLNGSPVFTDLLYVLAEPKALADFMETAVKDPATAIRKLVLTEQLVMAELAKTSSTNKTEADKGDGRTRDASGKFVSSENKDEPASETKPSAPPPPRAVGGRGTASEDPRMTAAKTGNFKQFEMEENRRRQALAKA